MFGGNKPFGTATAFTGNTFSTPGTGFGQTPSAFGARPATNMFGGGFGATTPAGTSNIFSATPTASGTGLFGQSTGFGTPVSTGASTFGSTGFGATTTTSSLFGGTSQPNTSSSLFGANTTSAFGAPRPAFGGFNSTSTSTPSLFGQPQQPAGGLFTQPTAASTSAGLFGASGFSTTPTGTTIKFSPPKGTDTMMKNGQSTTIDTLHQCISCMKEYGNKSLEELRMEDYSANRKGPQQTVGGFSTGAPSTGLFGVPTSTSSFSFGTNQNKPLFGGTAATPAFGTTTGTGLFGQTTQQPQPQTTGGLFNKPLGFGTPTTSAGSTFTFGQNQSTSLFGANTQQKSLFGQTTGSNLFGATPTVQPQTSVFGTTPGFGSFGATTQTSGGLLGVKPPVFGSTGTTGISNAFSFAAPAGTTATTTNFFGAKPAGTATSFPASTVFSGFSATPNTGTGLFGQTKPATSFGTTSAFGTGLNTSFGGLGGFGSNLTTNTGTSLFNPTSTANKPSPFGGFNTSFGNNFFSGQTNTAGTLPAFGNTIAPTLGGDPSAASLASQAQAQQQILALTSNPFGYSSLFNNPIKSTNRREEVLKPTNPSAQKTLLNSFKVPSQPTGKIKPKPLQTVANGKVSLFDGLEEEASSLANETFVPRKSVKKLTVKPKLSPEKPLEPETTGLKLTSAEDSSPIIHERNSEPHRTNLLSKLSPLRINSLENGSTANEDYHLNNPHATLDTSHGLSALENTISELQPRRTELFRAIHSSKPGEDDLDDDDISPGGEESQPESSSGLESNGEINEDQQVHECGGVLKRAGYYTIPPLDKLDRLVDQDGNCFVENFTIGRENYGNIFFPGITNVAGLNFDEIVHFRRKEVTVYVDDDKKPPVGEGLNKKAQVTLDCVWPNDRTSHSPIQNPERLKAINYEATLERATARMGAKFIEYRPETGSWVFQVNHF